MLKPMNEPLPDDGEDRSAPEGTARGRELAALVIALLAIGAFLVALVLLAR